MRTLFLLLGVALVGCGGQAAETPSGAGDAARPVEPTLASAHVAQARPVGQAEPGLGTAPADGGPRYPYVCEEFEVELSEDGRRRFRRRRVKWTEDDRLRFRRLVALVAREMGAEPKLLNLWALRESTYRPTAVHILNPDLEAASKAWDRYRWSEDRQRDLEAIMKARAGTKDKAYWQAKGALKRIQTFRDNPYYFDDVDYDVRMPSGESLTETRSRWAYGYGAFGFNPTYYVPIWDAEAPPWVFCNEDGIIAAVTAVWAARSYQQKCRALGYEGTYADVNRMFASGHCDPRPSHAEAFRSRAQKNGLPPDRVARLGKKWAREHTNRDEIVRFMRSKAVEAGLLGP